MRRGVRPDGGGVSIRHPVLHSSRTTPSCRPVFAVRTRFHHESLAVTGTKTASGISMRNLLLSARDNNGIYPAPGHQGVHVWHGDWRSAGEEPEAGGVVLQIAPCRLTMCGQQWRLRAGSWRAPESQPWQLTSSPQTPCCHRSGHLPEMGDPHQGLNQVTVLSRHLSVLRASIRGYCALRAVVKSTTFGWQLHR
jgi:hypothetical protein